MVGSWRPPNLLHEQIRKFLKFAPVVESSVAFEPGKHEDDVHSWHNWCQQKGVCMVEAVPPCPDSASEREDGPLQAYPGSGTYRVLFENSRLL